MNLKERAEIYRILSQLFFYPEDDFFEKLPDIEDVVVDVLRKNYDSQELVKQFSEAVDELRELPPEELQAEHTRLFINSFPTLPCPPYESAYREMLLMGDYTEEVSKYYSLYNLEIPEDLPDHISYELDFMRFLLEEGDESLAKEFFEEHIIQWVPDFIEDLRNESRLKFYKFVADLLADFLEKEKEAFNVGEDF